ncbi:adenylate cyclase, partial [Acinetobacter baumannii]
KEQGGTRAEFEYDIPRADALELLEKHCTDVIVKTRHYVAFEGFTWEIDEYGNQLAGIVIAEVELPAIDVPLPIPHWAGKEVTGRAEYKKINML